MLGKLLKHEMKATARLLSPIFLILASLTILNRIVISIDIFKGALRIIPGFITFFYVLSIFAIIVVTFVIIIYRFYKNLMTDEGYLMFTLPVKSHDLINSKLIASVLWTVAGFAAVILSIYVIFYGSNVSLAVREYYPIILDSLRRDYGTLITVLNLELIIMLILSIFNHILMVYVSIALGQLFHGHKILGSFASYIGLSVVIQVLSIFLLVIASYILPTTTEPKMIITQILPFSILLMIVLNIVYYLLTNVIFKKKLNLE